MSQEEVQLFKCLFLHLCWHLRYLAFRFTSQFWAYLLYNQWFEILWILIWDTACSPWRKSFTTSTSDLFPCSQEDWGRTACFILRFRDTIMRYDTKFCLWSTVRLRGSRWKGFVSAEVRGQRECFMPRLGHENKSL